MKDYYDTMKAKAVKNAEELESEKDRIVRPKKPSLIIVPGE